ncbi:ABC transporter ATP-binding protein [Acidianus manzaensis]|uniref:ABC transporter ATP-binding protein n=1 Tax=Acidianus manzaensis TaxID=282676 RepID=A0A1W6JWH7_9CREN|nr:ABC transporter ATP-binding protein [Acidianus manzaensis]ARM74613.1 ABC transporter ATP-binding protein [Acidianus manzaensis]
MEYIRLEDIWKIYTQKKKKTEVLRGLNLSIEKGELVVVLGPSGEGKTTLLRIISGLLKQDKGHVYLRGEIVDNVPPKDRNVSMVFQNYAIYPFMNVYDNIAFPLKLMHKSKEEIRSKVLEVSKMLRIDELLDRKPSQLSGGQMQRVAIARALVKGDDIILMDEPLANLDAQVRVIARDELKQLHRKLNTTIVYVTHDQTEALSLATKVALIHQGVIQAYGDPMEIYNNPNSDWVGSFIGTPPMNIIEGKIEGDYIVSNDIKIPVPITYKKLLKDNQKIKIGFRPENVKFGEGIEVYVDMVERVGPYTVIYVDIGGQIIRLIEKGQAKVEKGDKIKFSIDQDQIVIFDINSGKNLIEEENDKNS